MEKKKETKGKVLFITNPEGISKTDFLAIYKESAKENATSWYPDMSPEKALEKYEEEHWAYMQDGFWKAGGKLLIIQHASRYVSAIVSYPYKEQAFLLEAMETLPEARGQGYGTLALKEMINYLLETNPEATIYSFTSKKNIVSQKTHLSAGMTKLQDYWVDEDGQRDDTQITYKIDRLVVDSV